MAPGLGRVGTLALCAAMLLALGSVGPVAAGDAIQRHYGAEKYGLRLLNCTRTGGWVKADGSCVKEGSGKYSAYLPPLPRHKGISKKVAFPWARAMVRHEVCGHSIAGEPELSTRMTSSGFNYGWYGENVGCSWGWGSPKQVVLSTHRMFQSEKAANGGHWRNIKSETYKSVGIGVAYRNGVVMVVYDFYGKRT